MKILFISHDAHRAGAQIFLLNFLRWINKQSIKIEFEVLFVNSGILMEEFKEICDVHILKNTFSIKNLFKKKLFGIQNRLLYKKLLKKGYNLIYSNTIVNGSVLDNFSSTDIPVITHVHELEYWINKAGKNNLKSIKAESDYYITASAAVKNNLNQKHDININKISEVYVPIDIKFQLDGINKKSLKDYLKINKEAIIIGACGTEIFRKGKDWFIPIASQVLNLYKNKEIHFIWIGGIMTSELEFDLDHCGYKDKIHFINQLPNASNYFNEFDIFLMLSREDPFPTVNLEVGIWEVPILCFANSGGTSELIENSGGFIIPYANLIEMSKKIIFLLENPLLRISMGSKLKEKIIQNFDINVVGKKILSIITEKENSTKP